MPLSPRKFVSTVTNSTVNKGVEARETEIANIRLDAEVISSDRGATDSGDWAGEHWGRAGAPEAARGGGVMAAGDAPGAPPPLTSPSTDQSASYVQVVVQKQRRVGSRHPVASSPLHTEPVRSGLPIASLDNKTLPATVLLACPAFAALHQHSWNGARGLGESGGQINETAIRKEKNDVQELLETPDENIKKLYFWQKMQRTCKHQVDDYDEGPDCVEVYAFESGCGALVSRGTGHVSRLERGVRKAARPAAIFLNELLAIPRLAFSGVLHVALQLQRCLLLSLREAVTGAVQTTVDVLVKPLLALAFNSVLRPPLVCVAQTAGAIREALRPLSLALIDAQEPFASLISSLRLVQVETHCTRSGTHNV
ncbi:unnamed protein product [Danaus chrysippus]|uniref:(African queen) hypothetical protein n=1 Tax=Danaus chrysippus TaxID=151541 RepID=A0A8J2QA33_9NEOP|nr:unnamed protein product [Danaus chrysippus]